MTRLLASSASNLWYRGQKENPGRASLPSKWEACVLRLETGPCSQQLEESRAATKTQSSHTHTHKTQSGTLVSAIFKNGKKENPGNLWLCHFLVLRSPSSLPSLHLFADFFCLFYTWCLGFLVILGKKNKKSYVYSNFLETRILSWVLGCFFCHFSWL